MLVVLIAEGMGKWPASSICVGCPPFWRLCAFAFRLYLSCECFCFSWWHLNDSVYEFPYSFTESLWLSQIRHEIGASDVTSYLGPKGFEVRVLKDLLCNNSV